jgi:dTDP-4-amino-4,6-dideoxygalactose transaminase
MIPFNKPFIVGKELYYIAESVLGGHTSGDGPFSRRCEALMAETFGAKRVLLTTSCTSALEMAVLLAGLEPGDEVIVPSFTFVSTVNALLLRGVQPRFVDIRADTKNLDEALIDRAITDRTRAILPVHYAGVGCDMDAIGKIAENNGLVVIEDAAQGVNATYDGRYLGTIGDLGAYSFHETKNFICGEGGALILNNERYVERAEILREKGTNRSQFFRGEVDKYTWVDVGSSYLPSDILAAFLYGQLEQMGVITTRRAGLYQRYVELLSPLAQQGLIELPMVPENCVTNHHMFYVLLAGSETRQQLIEHLKKLGIHAVFHYVPLHTSPMGRKLGYREGQLPVTESISGRLLRLPFYYELTEQEIDAIADGLYGFFRLERPG